MVEAILSRNVGRFWISEILKVGNRIKALIIYFLTKNWNIYTTNNSWAFTENILQYHYNEQRRNHCETVLKMRLSRSTGTEGWSWKGTLEIKKGKLGRTLS